MTYRLTVRWPAIDADVVHLISADYTSAQEARADAERLVWECTWLGEAPTITITPPGHVVVIR